MKKQIISVFISYSLILSLVSLHFGCCKEIHLDWKFQLVHSKQTYQVRKKAEMNIATMDVIHDRTCVVSKQENFVFFFRGSSCRFFVQNTCNYFVASCFRIGFRRVNSLFDGLNCWCKCVVIRCFYLNHIQWFQQIF